MSSTDFTYTNNKVSNFEKLKHAIDYLKSLDPKVLIDDKLAYQAIFLLAKTHGYFTNDMIAFIEEKIEKMSSLMATILLELVNVLSELDFKNVQIDLENQFRELTKNDQRINLITFILYTVNLSLFQSFQFNIKFANQNGLKALLEFLRNDSLVEKILDVKITEFSRTPRYLVNYVVLDINSMSRFFQENAQIWLSLDTLNILLKIGKLKPDCQLDAYLAIANIATDKQIETFTEIHNVVFALSDILKTCVGDFRMNRFDRQVKQIPDEERKVQNVEVQTVTRKDGVRTNIITPLRGLYLLSVNSKLRCDIYFTNKIKEDLKVVLEKGNDTEQKYCLQLLCQLSFDSTIAKDILNDVDFMPYLKNKDNKLFENLKSTILWNLKTNNEPQEQTNNNKNRINKNEKHIMISYNTASRPLCLKIKSQLESMGHKIWIDVSNIHGASLDAMAKAVEEAYCILICVTEKYRLSLNCQAEAQYAFKLNKHVIPLVMEKGYENAKGWLGIIMSDKIFINFTKYEYDECIRRLKMEIDNYLNVESVSFASNVVGHSHSNSNGINGSEVKGTSVADWTENEVKEWFLANNVDKRIVQEFSPCTGVILKQLYALRKDAPEFFFQSLSSNKKVELKYVLIFTENLMKLFND